MGCKHKRISKMDWPDGGESNLCLDCLKTMHSTEWADTEWQDHQFNSESDWYRSAWELQNSMRVLDDNKITLDDIPADSVMVHFLDWFGTWQTDKILDDYGIDDIIIAYRETVGDSKLNRSGNVCNFCNKVDSGVTSYIMKSSVKHHTFQGYDACIECRDKIIKFKNGLGAL